MAAPLQNLSITLRVVATKKVSFSYTQNPKTVCWHIDSQWQAYMLNRDNLRQPVQIQLSQKETIFVNFVLHFQNLS